MITVRVVNGAVYEIVPKYALPAEVWYGADFAAQCHEAPDEVEQGWAYDPATGSFSPPVEVLPEREIAIEDDLCALLVDQEYRITLLELGVNANAV